MVNIYFQMAGMVLIIMIAWLFVSKTRLLFDTDKAFSYLLVSMLLAITLDIFAECMLELLDNTGSGQGIALWSARIACLAIAFVGFSVSVYASVAVRGRFYPGALMRYGHMVPLLIAILAAPFVRLHMEFRKDGVVYYDGVYLKVVYGILIFYLLVGLSTISKNKKRLQKAYCISILICIAILFVSAMITIVFSSYEFMNFTMALALFVIYMQMENPDVYLDYVTGALNDYAFQKWGTMLIEDQTGEQIFLISVSDADYIKKKMGQTEYESMLGDFVQQVIRRRTGKIFRLDSGEFVFVTKSGEDAEHIFEALKYIVDGLCSRYDIISRDDVKYGHIPSLTAYDNMLAFTQDLRFFIKYLQQLPADTLHVLDESALDEKKKEDFMVLSLKHAISENEVMVYYQPIYSTAKQRYTTAEALIRIKDLNGNFMPPEVFIPIAEQRGYILTLGHIVFEKVCRFIREQDLEKKGFDYIEINLSAVQCMQKGLASELVSIMKEYSVSPSFINLEITETAAIQSEKVLMRNMQRLIELGVSFSLDDYGSGYSNLDYVVRIPFRIVKLDKLLVWDSFKKEKTSILLKTSVEMFQKMHLKIVAEGVETIDQALFLESIGVEYLQGYYFSRPLPEEEFICILENNSKRRLSR